MGESINEIYLKGEIYQSLESKEVYDLIGEIKNNFLDYINSNDIENNNIIIFYEGDVSLVKIFADYFLPCKEFQVLNIKKILPVAVENYGGYSKKDKKIVQLNEQNWQIKKNNNNFEIKKINQEVDIDFVLNIEDLISIFNIKSENNNLNYDMESNKIIKRLIKERKIYLDRKLIINSEEHRKRVKELPKFHESNIFKWQKNNYETVDKGEPLAIFYNEVIKTNIDEGKVVNKKKYYEESILSTEKGCLFKLAKDETVLKENQIIGVVSNEEDTLEDIKEWLKSFNIIIKVNESVYYLDLNLSNNKTF
jgi:hypothetical protein